MNYIVRLFIVFAATRVIASQRGELQGCFEDRNDFRDLPSRVDSPPDVGRSADACIDACASQFYTYAGIQAGQRCYCGSSYGRYGPANCTIPCAANPSQMCGGPSSNSVYSTGFIISGPPQNLTLVLADVNSLKIQWARPRATNGGVVSYKVTVSDLSSGSSLPTTEPPKQYIYTNSTFQADLVGLMPASRYNISIRAATTNGDGLPTSAIYSTEITEPPRPDQATILSKDDHQMRIQIPSVEARSGPISAYQVVIYDESANFNFDPSRLGNYSFSQSVRVPFYIGAELDPVQALSPFVVGDSGTYGGYYNAPLSTDKMYTVIIGVVSRQGGVAKASYSLPAVYQTRFPTVSHPNTARELPDYHHLEEPPSVVHDSDPPAGSGGVSNAESDAPYRQKKIVYSDDSVLVTGLSVAIGICGTLLIISVVVYFLLRRHYGQRRPSDHQELTLQSPSSEVVFSENGFASSVLVLETDGDLDFMYDSLKDRFWQVPRPYLDLTDEVIGQGKYGTVYAGTAHRRTQQIDVTVHVTRAHQTENEREKKAFLHDLENFIKIGTHANVVNLIAGCEDKDLYLVCLEHYPSTLKDQLLDSRTMERYPVYAEKEHRSSTMRESQLIEIASSIARGMAHLANLRIQHRRLTARSILMVDETTPKISNFGLAASDLTPPYEFTRWTALETLKNRSYSVKSDVWSFGVVLWELVTLGGTPFAGVRSRDVTARVLRGSRLHQPKNIGDDLYQVMLQCWQVDMDERPTFAELSSILENMTVEGFHVDQFNLDLHAGFQYEKYEYDSEIQSSTLH